MRTDENGREESVRPIRTVSGVAAKPRHEPQNGSQTEESRLGEEIPRPAMV